LIEGTVFRFFVSDGRVPFIFELVVLLKKEFLPLKIGDLILSSDELGLVVINNFK